jgi:membrane protease YdiL (CAAX protease family)
MDVFVALGLLVLLTSVALAALGIDGSDRWNAELLPADLNRQMAGILAQALVSVAVVAISAISLRVRYRASAADLGWSAAKVGSDVRLGIVAFLAFAPPVYVLQICLVHWFESKHPLIELMRHNPQPPLIVVCIVSAVLVAPVIEEYVFRGLLQGWLERLAGGSDEPLTLVLGGPARRPETALDRYALKAGGFASAASESSGTGSALADPKPSGQIAQGDLPIWHDTARWPIAVSAFAFAILHVTHGPDWIPLFVLALGLGYLYRQTHRLLPVVVVHFLLNACSTLMLLVS